MARLEGQGAAMAASLRWIGWRRSGRRLLCSGYLIIDAPLIAASWLPSSTTLLFASSIYVVGPSIRLTTDNMALGATVAVLFLLDRNESRSDRSFAVAVLLAIIAVLTRQLYLWLVPMLGLYALTNVKWDRDRKLLAAGAATF